jgi:hypothetical protein
VLLLLALACASDEPAYAVQHLSVVPTASGLTGTQTWEFFDAGWAEDRGAGHFLCARSQTVSAELTAAPEGCTGCLAAYLLTVAELETTCDGDISTSRSYSDVLVHLGVGEVPEQLLEADPWPGRSFGWYLSYDAGVTVEPYGWAYDEALDHDGELGPAGWVVGEVYTLWPAFAWDLRG